MEGGRGCMREIVVDVGNKQGQVKKAILPCQANPYLGIPAVKLA